MRIRSWELLLKSFKIHYRLRMENARARNIAPLIDERNGVTELDKKQWNAQLKILRQLIKKETTYDEAKQLFFELHGMVHASSVSNSDIKTFEDEVWEDLTEKAARTAVNKKKRTVLYGMWHSARIEDMTMNLLVAEQEQVIDREGWKDKLKATIYDTGNALTGEAILAFSQSVSIDSLKAYRNAVAVETRRIVQNIDFKASKQKVSQTGLERILELGAVLKEDAAIWLIDFWGKKTAAGILLMPCTRHNLVHINESMEAKKRAK